MTDEEKQVNEEAIEGGDIVGLQKNSSNSEETLDSDKEKEEEVTKQDEATEDVPEEYDYSNVELPEGIELDKELTDEFSSAAKELKLSQTNADKFMAMGVKLTQKITQKFEDAIKEAQQNQIKSYATMLNNDPDIGGAKLKQSLEEANVAYSEFVSDDAANLLAQTGLNKHPAIVKVFQKIGKELKNDTIRETGDSRKTRTADDWYPNM